VLAFDVAKGGSDGEANTLHDLVNAAPWWRIKLEKQNSQNIQTQFMPTTTKSTNFWSLAKRSEEPHMCQALGFNTKGDVRYDSTAMRIGSTLATRDKKSSEGDDDNM
jgi:hypothetical protein